MDIRTKLALVLVTVALVSMAILGAFACQTSASLLEEISIRQLDALAESKKRDLEKVQEGWRDQLRLIKSRTPLATSLQSYVNEGDDASRQAVLRVIEDAATAVDDVDQIRILDIEGQEIVRYGNIAVDYERVVPDSPGDVVFNDSFSTNRGGARVVFSSLIMGDTSPIGVIEVVFDAFAVESVGDNYTGLGETGEVIVTMMEDEDRVLILNSLRHQTDKQDLSMPLDDASPAIRQSLSADAPQEWLESTDYRDVEVLAATRHMARMGWGLVVKVDVAEESARAIELRDALFDIAMALSAFAIVGGTMLGFYLARPIHDLAVMVERVRHGETQLRIDVTGDDEIAYLADSVNELLDHFHPEVDEDDDPSKT
ncbi:MAG: HAMP domain-containing protein [Gammaproteobacteria bacterium]|nr:HAMP domain-containing protein [Gammaproteobacteria bacterium]